MGLSLPCFGYFVARGLPEVRADRGSAWNKRNERAIRGLVEALSRSDLVPTVDEHFVYKNMAAGPKIMLADVWFETDTDNRPELRSILEKLGRQGTIVVPDKDHLFENNPALVELVTRMDQDNIAVVSVQKNNSLKARTLKSSLLDVRSSDLAHETVRNGVDNAIFMQNWLRGVQSAER